ncbi:hypothetical protein JCM11491_001034 [Sporobolomyces phaffii]
MPLDSNLFVLLVRPRAVPGWIDFVVDGTPNEVLYSAYREPAATPTYTLSDPLTSSSYGTLTQPPPSLPNATQPNPRLRSIVLDSPRVETKLNNVGKLSWEWSFEWQETTYVWTRDVVGLFGNERGYTLCVSRRPDPNYPVAAFHPRKKGGSIEIFDFNFARVEPAIEDKKGLEITLLLSLCFFLDSVFPISSTSAHLPPSPASRPSTSAPMADQAAPESRPKSPARPPPPPLRRGSGKSNGLLATNEVRIESNSDAALAGHCARCLSLLEDESLLYLVLTANKQPSLSASLVKLAEEVKRKRYKASGEEVKLFVDDSGRDDDDGTIEGGIGEQGSGVGTSTTSGTGLRAKKKASDEAYAPPQNLKIYLSRLELSDLLPLYNRQRRAVWKAPVLRPPINFDVDTRNQDYQKRREEDIPADKALDFESSTRHDGIVADICHIRRFRRRRSSTTELC